jgi:hypothetical protein
MFADLALVGEVQEHDGERWRTVQIGSFPVRDRRRVTADPAITVGFDGSRTGGAVIYADSNTTWSWHPAKEAKP